MLARLKHKQLVVYLDAIFMLNSSLKMLNNARRNGKMRLKLDSAYNNIHLMYDPEGNC